MIKKGRKSAAELSVVIPGTFGTRPDAPPDLNARQREIWIATVSSEPSGLFSTAAVKALLSDMCRHQEASEKISEKINEFKGDWLKSSDGRKAYKDLLQMRDLETRAYVGIATKLRLTNQARYTPQAAGTAGRHSTTIPKPWEQ